MLTLPLRTDLTIAIILLSSVPAVAQSGVALGRECAGCHPKEVAGFALSAMARSMRPVTAVPGGSFDHAFSGTRFEIRSAPSGVVQTLKRSGEQEALAVQYEVGSGSHAFGYLARVGDHLFQSPISYYTNRRAWDMAPGYENEKRPDFARPVTVECLICHTDKPLPIPDTLNRYQSPPFAGAGIGCDRCHGPTSAHLAKPVVGSIINPAKLDTAARDSACEQCHLTGEIRIPNPGKTLIDFRPGQKLEDAYTVYLASQEEQSEVEKRIKVVSQAEELALSLCSRRSGGNLWCGTCHDPHNVPAQPVQYFREKCLGCHAATLDAAHAALGRDCIACHMPKRDATDGGHTAFTDHRITRRPEAEGADETKIDLKPWREPDPSLRARNLALALVTNGLQQSNSNEAVRGFRMLSRLEPQFAGDPDVETALGNVLLKAKEAAEAKSRFANALRARPNYAPYEVNVGASLLASGDLSGAKQHLEHAVELDPLLEQAVELLATVYRSEGQSPEAEVVLERYRSAMGMK